MRRDRLPHPDCEPTCPRQATHMWRDCECGGAQREFDRLRDERARLRADREHIATISDRGPQQ